jgi:hypothetical protein
MTKTQNVLIDADLGDDVGDEDLQMLWGRTGAARHILCSAY